MLIPWNDIDCLLTVFVCVFYVCGMTNVEMRMRKETSHKADDEDGVLRLR